MQYWVYPNAILYVYKLTFTTFNIEIHTKTNWKLKFEKTQLYKEQCLFSQQSTLTSTSTRTFTENHSFVLNEVFGLSASAILSIFVQVACQKVKAVPHDEMLLSNALRGRKTAPAGDCDRLQPSTN